MNFLSVCGDLAPIIRLIKHGVLPVLYFAVGIIIIILVIIDIAKAVIASDEKEVKGYQKAAIRRVIYGIVIFFVVIIISAIFNILTAADDPNVKSTWYECWQCIGKTAAETKCD